MTVDASFSEGQQTLVSEIFRSALWTDQRLTLGALLQAYDITIAKHGICASDLEGIQIYRALLQWGRQQAAAEAIKISPRTKLQSSSPRVTQSPPNEPHRRLSPRQPSPRQPRQSSFTVAQVNNSASAQHVHRSCPSLVPHPTARPIKQHAVDHLLTVETSSTRKVQGQTSSPRQPGQKVTDSPRVDVTWIAAGAGAMVLPTSQPVRVDSAGPLPNSNMFIPFTPSVATNALSANPAASPVGQPCVAEVHTDLVSRTARGAANPDHIPGQPTAQPHIRTEHVQILTVANVDETPQAASNQDPQQERTQSHISLKVPEETVKPNSLGQFSRRVFCEWSRSAQLSASQDRLLLKRKLQWQMQAKKVLSQMSFGLWKETALRQRCLKSCASKFRTSYLRRRFQLWFQVSCSSAAETSGIVADAMFAHALYRLLRRVICAWSSRAKHAATQQAKLIELELLFQQQKVTLPPRATLFGWQDFIRTLKRLRTSSNKVKGVIQRRRLRGWLRATTLSTNQKLKIFTLFFRLWVDSVSTQRQLRATSSALRQLCAANALQCGLSTWRRVAGTW